MFDDGLSNLSPEQLYLPSWFPYWIILWHWLHTVLSNILLTKQNHRVLLTISGLFGCINMNSNNFYCRCIHMNCLFLKIRFILCEKILKRRSHYPACSFREEILKISPFCSKQMQLLEHFVACCGTNLPAFWTLCNDSKQWFSVLFIFLVLQERNICKIVL